LIKDLFASLEGKRCEEFGREKKEQVEVEEKETILRGKDFGVHFFLIIQNLPHLGELKSCIG